MVRIRYYKKDKEASIMGVLVGNPRKTTAYPVSRRIEAANPEKKQESYMVHLSKRLLENYRAFIETAEHSK